MTQWKFIDATATADKEFYISVVKIDYVRERITWISSNTVVTNGDRGWQTYDVPEDEQMTVEKGYVVVVHYESINDEDNAVIPRTAQIGDGIKEISLGFEVPIDQVEIGGVAKPGVEIPGNIRTLLKSIGIEPFQKFRTPALAGTVVPL